MIEEFDLDRCIFKREKKIIVYILLLTFKLLERIDTLYVVVLYHQGIQEGFFQFQITQIFFKKNKKKRN